MRKENTKLRAQKLYLLLELDISKDSWKEKEVGKSMDLKSYLMQELKSPR